MKVDSKIVQSDPGVTQDLLFQDKVIHKLRREKGSRKDFKFKDIKVSIKILQFYTTDSTLIKV